MVLFTEIMKYKPSLVSPDPLSRVCRQGKEESRHDAGRKQAGGRHGAAVTGQTMPGQQELVGAGDVPQEWHYS